MKKEESKNIYLGFKINYKQETKIKEFINNSGGFLTKSFIICLGLQEALETIQNIYNETDGDLIKFQNALKNPQWYKAGCLRYLNLIKNLSPQQIKHFKINLDFKD